jgi:hypothetical protein
VGSAIIEIRVDADGHIDAAKPDPDRPAPAPVIQRMIDNAVLLLRSGTFSLDARTVSTGTERLSIDVSLSDGAPNPDPDAALAPRKLFAEGFDAPTPDRAGSARFTLNSGRHMQAVVRLLK